MAANPVGAAHFQEPWDFHGRGISQPPARVFASGMFFSPQRLHFIRTRALGTQCPVKTAQISHCSAWTPKTVFPANWKSCFSLVKESFPCLVGGRGKIPPCFRVRETEIPELTQENGTQREIKVVSLHAQAFMGNLLQCLHGEAWLVSHGAVGAL